MPVGVTTGYYRVAAWDSGVGAWGYSPILTAQVVPFDTTALSPPSYLDVRVVSTGCTPSAQLCDVELRWCPPIKNEQVTGYKIYRAGQPGGPYTQVQVLTALADGSLPISWVDSGLDVHVGPGEPSRRYYYVVASVRGSEESGFSNENSAGDRYPLQFGYPNFDY